MINGAKQLVLFDFDGTITSRDTLFQIAKFSSSPLHYHLKLVSLIPAFALAKLGLISKQKGKERFLSVFFSGYTYKAFDSLCRKFAQDALPILVRKQAAMAIESHKWTSKMVIVSASPENWIRPWADTHGFEVIATKLKFDDDVFKGKIDGKNCNGEEKVVRIKEALDLSQFEKIIAYGDSKGDLPMLALAHEKHLKPFK